MKSDIIAAVDASQDPASMAETRDRPNVPSQTIAIMGRASSQAGAREADVVIKPDMGEVAAMDFDGRKHAIEMDEHAALEEFSAIRGVLKLGMRR